MNSIRERGLRLWRYYYMVLWKGSAVCAISTFETLLSYF